MQAELKTPVPCCKGRGGRAGCAFIPRQRERGSGVICSEYRALVPTPTVSPACRGRGGADWGGRSCPRSAARLEEGGWGGRPQTPSGLETSKPRCRRPVKPDAAEPSVENELRFPVMLPSLPPWLERSFHPLWAGAVIPPSTHSLVPPSTPEVWGVSQAPSAR
ncbi:casein kinase I isoform alpha [Platysternon megacephalum]|uniref:Casein kinase I isoform alpha n=1 Tax=Platysternon megacephalum TaxID=55544 RepID=A0A4D9EWG6_9SAUR|nr:casein kinase I isoform alpha [Platysternon megacephalum]